jgi:hypothetical protein
MRLRRAALTVALAVVPLVATATPAQAVSCPLISDPLDASTYYPFPGGIPTSQNADIVSVDLASGPTTVAVAMRVAALDPDLFTALGPEWFVAWYIGTNHYGVIARRTGSLIGGPATYVVSFQMNGTDLGSVPFSTDAVTDTVSWTVPRSLLPDLATPGATFTTIFAGTRVLSGTTDYAPDWPTPFPSYVDQSPGCIPAS